MPKEPVIKEKKEMKKKKPTCRKVVDNTRDKQLKTYFELLKTGAMFLKYIKEDIKKQRADKKMDRSVARRIEKSLNKGLFSDEVIDMYFGKIESILIWIDYRLKETEKLNRKAKSIIEKRDKKEQSTKPKPKEGKTLIEGSNK